MALGSETLSEQPLQLAVLLAFASGVLVGWQANRMRSHYLDWRKRRLQDQLSPTQKKLDRRLLNNTEPRSPPPSR